MTGRPATVEWILLFALAGVGLALAYSTRSIMRLELRVAAIELDLNLGDEGTTRNFRRSVLTGIEAIQEQVRANASIMADISDRLTRITCECPGGVCTHTNAQGACDNPNCSPPDKFQGSPPGGNP